MVVVALLLIAVAGSIALFLALSGAFDGETPSVVGEPTQSATAAPSQGCPEPVRYVVEGDFDEDLGTDSATIECLDGASRLQVEWSSGARGEWPLTVCDVGCAPWALPDLDGDGDQELLIESAIEAEGIDGAYVTIFDMYPSEATGTPLSIVGGELGGVPQGTLPGFPVGEPAVFPIGDSEGSSSALSCSAPRLSWERSTLEDDGSWTVRTVVVGVHAGRQSAKARAEALSETVVPGASGPVEQEPELCGSPVGRPEPTDGA